MNDFRPHDLNWTPDHVRRFWDYYSSKAALQEHYFAKSAGPALLRLVSSKIDIGTAADIGCGRGDLIELLLRRGHDVYAVDQSPGSIELVRGKFGADPKFKAGALFEDRIDLRDATVDTAFMVEVIEHLDDQALPKVIAEARRVIRPGGHLVITTPNDENLALSQTMCPDCGSVYHMMQHVRSWSGPSLSAYLRHAGFEPEMVKATALSKHSGALALAYQIAYRAVRKRYPHLIYIGKRLPD